MDLINTLMQLTVLVFAVIVHEVSHGYVAYKLGDPTAKLAGRLTLNPLPHIDLFWSIIMPIVFLLTTGVAFGGAKPVPINPAYFRNYKRDIMLSSAAGPVSNIMLAVISAVLLKITTVVHFLASPGLVMFLGLGIIINVFLAVFNLIPLPPLDGSKVLAFFMPDEMAWKYLRMEQLGFIILMALIFTGALKYITVPLYTGIMSLISRLM